VDNFSDATNGKTVRSAVAVGWVAGTAVKVQVVTISATHLRTAPAVPVATSVGQRTCGVITVAGCREEHAPSAVSSRYKITAPPKASSE